MAQYTNLNAPPERSLREIIDEKIQTRGSATGAAGVKDLGLSGDVVWTRPDASSFSVRDVDLDLADARQRIEDAEGALVLTEERLSTAEGAVASVQSELDSIDWENLDGAEVYTDGPPPINPTIGKALWVSPSGRVFRAIECEEHA